MKLTINIRLYRSNNTNKNLKQKNFAEFLLKIDNSKHPLIPNMEDIIKLPSDIIILKRKLINLINFIYSNLIKNFTNVNYMVSRTTVF